MPKYPITSHVNERLLKSKKKKKTKLARLNWHWGESNLRPRGGAHSHVPSQYLNPKKLMGLMYSFHE